MNTKDPHGINQHEKGAKLDQGKSDLSMLALLSDALTEVCLVMTYGEAKYSRGGFKDVPDAVRRYTSAMERHWFAEQREFYDSGDPFYDTEEGLPFKGRIRHDAQVACNALFRLQCALDSEMQERRDFEDTLEMLAEKGREYNDEFNTTTFGPLETTPDECWEDLLNKSEWTHPA